MQNKMSGCRITEFDLYGRRAVRLENDFFEAGILVGWGLTVYELIDKETGTDFMYRERVGLKRIQNQLPVWPNPAGIFWDSFIGGWFELFPNAGKACEVNGVAYPQHGEVMQAPWDMEVLENTPERIRLRFSIRTFRTPFALTREMEIRKDMPALYLDEQIENLSREAQPYLWGHHFTIGGTFLNANCRISLPKAQITGSTIPVPAILGPDSHVNESLFADRMEESWAAVTDPEKDLGVGLCWDGGAYPALWIWKEFCGLGGFPFYGGCYALGLEPQKSATPILRNAMADGTAGELKGHEKKTSWMTVRIYRGPASVRKISRDGNVL